MDYPASHHKILKRIVFFLLTFLLLVFGVGIFLRTDAGLRFSLNMAQSFLEKQGMLLSYESVSGPLPTHLSFKDLRITDQKGVLFEANTIAVDIQLLPLIHGTLTIPHVILDDAYLLRIPESSSQTTEDSTSKGFSLPIDINLGNIEIRNVRMAETLLFPPDTVVESPPTTEEQNASFSKKNDIPTIDQERITTLQKQNSTLRMSLSGNAGVSGNELTLALQGSVALGDNEGMDIIVALDNGKKVKNFLDTTKETTPAPLFSDEEILPEGLRTFFPSTPQAEKISEQWLALHVRGVLSPRGKIANILSLPNNAGGAFLIHGISPLLDWKGSLGFALIDSQRNIPVKGKGSLQLALTGNSSFLSHGKNIKATAAIVASAGRGYETLPSIVGKTCYLTASAEGTISHFTTNITLETAPWKLSARKVSLTRKADRTSLIGQYSFTMPRLTTLPKDQMETSPSAPALITAEALLHEAAIGEPETLSLHKNSQKNVFSPQQEAYSLVIKEVLSSIALTQKDQWKSLFLAEQTEEDTLHTQNATTGEEALPLFLLGDFSFLYQEEMQATSNGTLQTRIKNKEHSLSYTINANSHEGSFQLNKLSLDGLGLSLHASGSAALEDIANGNVSFDLFASGKENAPWQALVSSFLYTEQLPPEQPLNGAFSFEAHATPDAVHGTKANIQLTTNNMQWGTAQEQSLLGNAPHLAMNFLGGGNLPWEAHVTECSTPFVSGTLDAFLLPNKQQNITAASEDTSLAARSQIQASAQMSLPNLALLSKDLKGSATIKATADGPLYDVATKITVESSSIEIPTGSITNILGDLTTQISLPVTASEPLRISGNVSAQAKDSYGGNFSIHSSWTVKEKQEKGNNQKTSAPLEIAMPEFLATGAGIHISANGSGIIDSSPHLTGRLSLSVTDWAHFSAITGLPLSGGKTEVSVQLSSQAEQKITTTILSKDLHTKDNTFSVASLSGTIDVNNLFGIPQPSASLHIGEGYAGPLDWRKGTVLIQHQKENTAIPIRVSLSGKPITTSPLAPKKQKNISSFKPTDRVALDALFYPKESYIELHSFGLYFPKNQTGLYLSKKSTIRFSPSLAVENLRMECMPKGSIAVDTLFSPIKTSLEATVTELPIERFGALAGVEVPEGSVSISASLHRNNSKVEGTVSTQGVLANRATQRENVTLPFSMKAHIADNPSSLFPQIPFSQGGSHFIGKGTLSPQSTITKSPAPQSKQNASSHSEFAFDLPIAFTSSGIPLLDTKKYFGFSLRFNGAIESLWQVISSPDREFTGLGNLMALYTGTFENPQGKLTASIKNGQFEDHILGIFLTNIALTAKTENSAKDDLKIRALLFATDGKKQRKKGLLDKKQENGTIAIEALIGQKAQIIDSSVAKNLALRSGKEAQKIVGKEIEQTSKAKEREKASLDWNSNSTKKASKESGGENTTKLFAQKKVSAEQEHSQKGKTIKKHTFQPIVSLADTRIADTDMSIVLRGQVHNLEPLERDDISLQLSGLLGVEGRLTSPHITGDLLMQRIEVLLELLSFGKSVTTLPIEQKGSIESSASEDSPTADIHIGLPGRTFIRGFGLDSEWQGDANIKGKLSSPLLSGSLHTIGGDVELLSKPFEFSKGEIFFLGGVGTITPGIDIELVNRSSSLEAHVRVTGTASDPKFELASVPSLPKDEIVSQVLFSKRSSSLSRFEALQLADTLNDLFGESNKSLLSFSSVRKKIGIDVLRVNSGNTEEGRKLATSPNAEDTLTSPSQSESDSEGVGNMSVEAGKYIQDNVYVGVEQNAQDGTAVKVDIEVTPKMSIQGTSTQKSSQIGVGWKMDY